MFTSSPLAIITGIATGTIIGMSAGSLFSLFNKNPGVPQSAADSPGKDKRNDKLFLKNEESDDKLLLKKEALDIYKKRVQTGAVSVHKELLTENKIIVVPVTREELVIEKKVYGTDNLEEPEKETIRIPIKTEKIDIVKRPVILEDVSVYKRKLQKTQHIKATVKKENLRVESKGDPEVKEIRKYRVTK